MDEIITAIVLILMSVGAFIMSIRSFLGKGLLLNNAYLFATEKEREAMDKAPYYKQSALVFALIGLIFLLNGLGLLFRFGWVGYIVAAVVVIAMVYAIASSIAIAKKKKNS